MSIFHKKSLDSFGRLAMDITKSTTIESHVILGIEREQLLGTIKTKESETTRNSSESTLDYSCRTARAQTPKALVWVHARLDT